MLQLLLISAYTPLPPPTLNRFEDQQDWAEANHVGVDDLQTLMQYRTLNQMEEYAGAVWKLLQHIKSSSKTNDDTTTTTNDNGHHHPNHHPNEDDTLGVALRLPWKSDRNHQVVVLDSTSWRMELDFALWNLAALSLNKYQPPPPQPSPVVTTVVMTKLEWNAMSQSCQTAASFLHHCSHQLSDAALYETLFVAEGQRCVYQAFAGQPRPKHFLLAKLCMTVANVYTRLEEEYEMENDIADAVRAWGMYLSALAEYHQHYVEVEGPAAAARLENARKFGSFCADFLLETCHVQIPELKDFITLLDEIPNDPTVASDELFDLDELPEIPAQPAVIKINPQLESMLKKIPTDLFRPMRPEFMPLLTQFHSTLQSLVQEKTRMAERKTETARTALQSVHLPQSITAYTNAEQTLNAQHDMTELTRSAETAWALVARMDRLIDDDSILSPDIQSTFRNALTQYQTLLEKAAASDSALRERNLPAVPSTTPRIVTELSRSLAQLSVLFHERDDAVQKLRSELDRLYLKDAIRKCETEEEVQSIFDSTRRKLEEGWIATIDQNFEQQSKLLYQIMDENDRFQRDEDLAMVEDAVSQHERFARHLQEGLAFYQAILPKLKKLDAQVLEVWERLSSERTVDDEKVANLVAMDFEFEKVVHALRKHDNNLEQALNDLLSC